MNAIIISRAIVTTGIWSGITIIDSVRGRLTLDRGDEIIRAWSKRLLEQVDVRLKISGLENIQPGKTYVVMSNHQSLYDIPTLITALPLRLRMVAKAELFNVPIWSQAMRSAGFVPVHRGQRERAMQDLRMAQDALSRGVNIWIAPEGTRSKDGELLPFKSGGFLLASTAKVPILPITIDGTRNILPARALDFVKGVEVNVRIGSAISATNFTRKDRNRFVESVRESILTGFNRSDPNISQSCKPARA
jgi:1-acyl-sn-glycerol-3-phosphate acyltransferase